MCAKMPDMFGLINKGPKKAPDAPPPYPLGTKRETIFKKIGNWIHDQQQKKISEKPKPDATNTFPINILGPLENDPDHRDLYQEFLESDCSPHELNLIIQSADQPTKNSDYWGEDGLWRSEMDRLSKIDMLGINLEIAEITEENEVALIDDLIESQEPQTDLDFGKEISGGKGKKKIDWKLEYKIKVEKFKEKIQEKKAVNALKKQAKKQKMVLDREERRDKWNHFWKIKPKKSRGRSLD